MKLIQNILCCFVVSLFTLTVLGQTSILPANVYSISGNVGAGATAEPINISGQSFTQGYRLTVPSTTSSISDAQISWANSQAVNANDNLQLTFWVRKVAPLDEHNIRGYVSFEQVATPNKKSLFTSFPCDSNTWTKYIIPFKSAALYNAGEAQLSFQFAFGPQTFEIGGISLVNLGATPPLPSGSSVISGNYSAYFDSGAGGGSATNVAATGQSFSQAIQVNVVGTSANIYNAGLGWNNSAALTKDDVMLLSFWMRKIEPASGNTRAQVVFERNGGDFAKAVQLSLPVDTTEWQLFQVPFKSNDNYAANGAHLVFQFAYGPQKFELGGVTLTSYGQSVLLSQLPTSTYYPQRGNLNAPWRLEANSRIEQIRKGDLKVNVVDRNGNPINGANVYVQQINHAYKFGSAITAQLLTQNSTDAEIYRSRVSSHFTTSVFENDLKWGLWECTTCGTVFNKPNTRTAIQWLVDRNVAARGHNLIWPSWQYLPSGFQSLGANDLQTRITTRFNDVLNDTGVKGKLYQWDVLNEPYTNYDVQGRISGVNGVTASNGLLGNQEMIRWFQLARQLEPNTKLFINDYDILAGGGTNVQHQDYYYAVIKYLLDNGAPVDGAGMQGHFAGVTSIDLMQNIIARYSQLNVRLAVTEYDFNTADEALQADFTRDFMTLIFSSPKFDDFLMWGFWERAHWLPNGAMYRADWSSKQQALVWNDLLFREWWTNETGNSDASGIYRTRGFKGDYNVTVNYARTIKTVTTKLDASGEVTVMLDVDGRPRSGGTGRRGPTERTVSR